MLQACKSFADVLSGSELVVEDLAHERRSSVAYILIVRTAEIHQVHQDAYVPAKNKRKCTNDQELSWEDELYNAEQSRSQV